MATIKIDTAVDAAQFDTFLAAWTKYRDAFREQPAAWEAVAASAGQTREGFAQAADSMRALADNMDDVLGRTRSLGQETERTVTRWSRLSRHTKDAASHIKGATESILKWAGIGGLVMGAAGFGAEHAIFDVAGSVGARRSTAMGLGTTYGGLAAARADYARFGDADSVLGNIAAAQNDPSKRLAFQNLGITDWEGKDTADLLSETMKRAKDKLDAMPKGIGLTQYAQNTHLDDIFSSSELQRLQHDSRDEVYGQADAIGRDRKGLDLAPDVQRKWQELSTQLGRAGTTIETALINRLVALEPGLEHLSDALSKAGVILLAKDGPVAQWLEEADKGLDWLAKELGDPQTQKGIGDFVTQVGEAAKYVWDLGKSALGALHWLAGLVGDTPGDASKPDGSGGITSLTPGAGIALGGGGNGPVGGGGAGLRGHGGGDSGLNPRARVGNRRTTKGAWWTDDRIQHAYDKLVAGGLTPREAEGQIARMAYVEAGAGPTASNNIGGGHYGIFQADRARQRDFGGSSDFDAQLDAIVKEKNSSESRSHQIGLGAQTDYDAARSASAFERAENYNPRTGEDAYTATTAANIPKIHQIVTRRPAAPAPAKVTVSKNPGGNTIATAAAVAAPQ